MVETKKFLLANKTKLRFYLIVCLSLSVPFILTTLVHFITDESPSYLEDLGRLIVFIFLLSALLFGFVFVRGALDFTIIYKLFSNPPFSQLEEVGFKKEWKNEEHRWKFNIPCYRKKIGGFVVTANVDLPWDSKKIKFHANANITEIDPLMLKKWAKELVQKRLIIEADGISRIYQPVSQKELPVETLLHELDDFIDRLYRLDLKPMILNQNQKVVTLTRPTTTTSSFQEK